MRLKITRTVLIDQEKADSLIESHGVSTFDIRRAVEHWVRKQPIPDLTDRIEEIITAYENEVGIKRKTPSKDEMGI